jgi:heat shock protein HslJ
MTPPLLMIAAALQAAAPAPPETYRAHGTEPFWSIEIANSQVTFDGTEVARFSEPVMPRDLVNGATSRYTSQRITLIVVAGAECSNGMSEEFYPDTTVAVIDGQIYANGCGGDPLPVVPTGPASPPRR